MQAWSSEHARRLGARWSILGALLLLLAPAGGVADGTGLGGPDLAPRVGDPAPAAAQAVTVDGLLGGAPFAGLFDPFAIDEETDPNPSSARSH